MSTARSAIDATQIEADAHRLADTHPADIIAEALARFDNITISFSGAEDVVLVDFAAREAEKLGRSFNVFTLDTGRLHPETLEFIQQVRDHYGVPIEAYYPNTEAVQALVREKGLFSFRTDGHQQCCGIRKVEPLGRALAYVDAYVTGQRKDQSPGTRAEIPVVQLDPGFGREDDPLVKFNPLANWTSAQVWQHIMAYGVPYNPLHDQGFKSIGCAPCTRATHPGEHERAGRWWWEEATQKECGLHSINLEP
ncbi:MAG: phosphoadenylyl-sulfate reductase [Chloroflexi bacterium]|nr:phosphoadenylyl-sulfate reductase [Chloroflexota bacterium]